jgi:hypothetical protein
MRYFALVIPAILLTQGVASLAQTAIPQVVLIAKVTQIKAEPLKQSKDNWVVTVAVEMVESGDFTEPTLVFRIHSPSKSMIEIGKRYRIRAKKVKGQYIVQSTDTKAI